uniref:Uncharacterized protein n=1 Tax=Romanomermis culicivorax TaxID=13658 RepID=A0A915KIX7_ROMCU
MSENVQSTAPANKEPGDDTRALLQHVTKSVVLSYKRFALKLFRCTHPDELEILPTPQFLIGPRQRQSLQVSKAKESSILTADKKMNLVLEAAICMQKRDDRRLLQSNDIWKQIPAKTITRVRLPIQISSQQSSESDSPLIVECKENCSMIGKDYSERVKNPFALALVLR